MLLVLLVVTVSPPFPDVGALDVRCPVLTPASAGSLLNANHSPPCGFQALVDTALETSAAFSSAVLTSIKEVNNGEWSAFKRELTSETTMLRPLVSL